jgi:hypothetical protein
MSKLRTSGHHPLETGGFLSFVVVADITILVILGFFATHTVRRAAELAATRAGVGGWMPVLVASTILSVLFPLIAGRLWSQVSTRYTARGISQWRFLTYRSLDWPDVVRVYYDRQGMVLEGETRAIRIIASCYRRPEQMLRVVHAHLSRGANQPARETAVGAVRATASEFQRAGAQASSA